MKPTGADRRVGNTLLALLIAIPAVACGQGTAERNHIFDLLRGDRQAAALPLLRSYVGENPGDGAMLFNLACAEANHGTTHAAVAAARSALGAGFEDLDLMRTDPDLASLRDDPSFEALLTEESSRLTFLGRERGADLTEGAPSEPLTLRPVPGEPPVAGDADIHLRWLPLGLEITLEADGAWAAFAAAGSLAPWRGGAALFVTLAAPRGAPSYATENAWMCAFGHDGKDPVGALYLPARNQWQRVVELSPRFTGDPVDTDGTDGRITARAVIPWATIMPFHPLVDSPLGLNIALRIPRDDGQGFHMTELLPDPARFRPEVPRRRTAMLTFDAASTAAETFVGRVSDSVSRGSVMEIELTAIVHEPGRGTLSLDFLDAEQQSVVPAGAQSGGVELPRGVNTIRRTIDFSGLRMGAYLLRAGIVFPAGARADWSTTILHLLPDWDVGFAERIASLPERERATPTHQLALARAAYQRHQTRRSPGALATTIAQLDGMIAQGERTGTILPVRGTFNLAAAGPDGALRTCACYRSDPDGTGARPRPVLFLTDASGYEDRITERMLQFDTGQTNAEPLEPVVYIVPRLPRAAEGTAAVPLDEAQAALNWALGRFGADQVAIVGLDAAAPTALELAAANPERVSQVLLVAGAGLELQGDGALPMGLRPDLPLTWLGFPMEMAKGGDAQLLKERIAASHLENVDDDALRGGMSLSQVADRVVVWARKAAGEGP